MGRKSLTPEQMENLISRIHLACSGDEQLLAVVGAKEPSTVQVITMPEAALTYLRGERSYSIGRRYEERPRLTATLHSLNIDQKDARTTCGESQLSGKIFKCMGGQIFDHSFGW